jgi:zinc protease
LVDDQRLASSVSCDQSDLRLAGAFEVRVALRPGQAAQAAEEAVHAQLALLSGDKPISEAEVVAAKNRMKTDELRELASVDGRADLLGHTWATAGSLAGHGKWWQQLEQLQVADVQRAAKNWLTAERLVTVVAAPRPAPPPERVSKAGGAKR